ncbi:hypothetical protein AHAS_Ahas05G0204100 [Arachis hypogaea]
MFSTFVVCLRMRKLMMLQKTRMIKLSHYYNIIRDRLNSGCFCVMISNNPYSIDNVIYNVAVRGFEKVNARTDIDF